MKKIFALFLISIFSLSSTYLFAHEEKINRFITVSGEGKVKAIPDKIAITLAVETWNKDIEKAKKLNDDATKKTLNLAKEFKISDKDIQTSRMNIDARQKYDRNNNSKHVEYYVNKTIFVTMKDVENFDGFISEILKAGVNNVQNIQFQSSEEENLKNEARKKAVANAKAKAELLAGELEQKVGVPFAISETVGSVAPMPHPGLRMAAMEMSHSTSGPSIALGEITINATISVSFELE